MLAGGGGGGRTVISAVAAQAENFDRKFCRSPGSRVLLQVAISSPSPCPSKQPRTQVRALPSPSCDDFARKTARGLPGDSYTSGLRVFCLMLPHSRGMPAGGQDPPPLSLPKPGYPDQKRNVKDDGLRCLCVDFSEREGLYGRAVAPRVVRLAATTARQGCGPRESSSIFSCLKYYVYSVTSATPKAS